MYLELADNNDMSLQDNDMYLQDNDMYLQDHDPQMALAQNNTDEVYLFVPNLNSYVREDYFDDLPDMEWMEMMEYLEGVQPGMSLLGLGKKGRARRAGRREIRQAKKIETMTTRAKTGGGIVGAIKGITTAATSILAPSTATTPPVEVGVMAPSVYTAVPGLTTEAELKKKKMQRNLLYGGIGAAALVTVIVIATRKRKT